MAQTQANLDAEINTLLASGIDITAATLRVVLHDMNAAVFQSGITGLASPTAQIGTATQAGSATTAMRSDAAPALNQGINPVWSGVHTFAGGVPATSPTTGALQVASPGGVGVGGSLYVAGTIASGTVGSAGQIQMSGSVSGASTVTINALGTVFQMSGSLEIAGGLSCNGSVSGTNVAVPLKVAQRLSGTVSGTVSTSDYPISIIPGATVVRVTAYTTTAFAAGTLSLTAGTAVGDNAYISSTSITGVGIVTFTFGSSSAAVNNLAAMKGPLPNFFVRLTQTGGTSVVGAALIIIEYLVVP